MPETFYKSRFIQRFDPTVKLYKVHRKTDVGYTSFYPGEAVIPSELGMEERRIKMLQQQRALVYFDKDEDTKKLVMAFKKKLRILRAGEKLLQQRAG